MDPIQAFLFDMDGVVIDTHASVEYYWNQLAAKHNVTLTVTDYERFIHGVQSRPTLDRYFGMLSEQEKDFIAEDILVYEDQLAYTCMPGVLDFLSALKFHGVLTALVTSGTQRKVDAVFGQCPLADKFDVLVTADVVKRGKPDPECYQQGITRLGVPAAQAIVFEDSRSGTQAGLGAGASVIGIGKTDMLLELGAVEVMPDFSGAALGPSDDGTLQLWTPSGQCYRVARK